MDGTDQDYQFTVSLHQNMAEISVEDWARLNVSHHPFTSHLFLDALEKSGSVGGDTGWDPLILSAADETGRICAVLPLYLKYHSYGEYVFDHSWAHALERAGGRYYPKLLGAVPFTPVPGPRLLSNSEAASTALIRALPAILDKYELSSAHINFIQKTDEDLLAKAGWMIRSGVQFHWHNQGYEDFDDFLAQLSSRKRKNIRKERASLQQRAVTFQALTGADLKAAHWDFFYQCYLATIDKKWGGAYLTRGFFEEISTTMADDILLIYAELENQPIAAALNFIGTDALYGRNWGCITELPNLHFETCYYQAIDFAISRGLKKVEAGAQGYHKVGRGYLPVETKSAHLIRHQGLKEAVARYLTSEKREIEREIEAIGLESPYRKSV